MNILVFGYGKKYRENKAVFDEDTIIAILDNDVKETVNEIVPVIHPSKISEYTYDKIVICVGRKYILEICRELTQKYNVDPDNILTIDKYINGWSRYEGLGVLEVCRDLGTKRLYDSSDYLFDHGVIASGSNGINGVFAIERKETKEADSVLLCGDGDFQLLLMDDYYDVIIDVSQNDKLKSFLRQKYMGFEIKKLDTKITVYQKKSGETGIYVIAHKDFKAPKSQMYKTLYVGKNLDEGIERYNPILNEYTGLYWMWNNATEDIVGLNHYRRYFSGGDSEGFISEQEVAQYLEKYDIILAQSIIFSTSNKGAMLDNMPLIGDSFEQAENLLIAQIEEICPEYIEEYYNVMNGKVMFPCNMFITSREIMKSYCEWIFPLIIPAAKKFENRGYDSYSMRSIGFIVERMFTVWIISRGLKIKEIPIVITSE